MACVVDALISVSRSRIGAVIIGRNEGERLRLCMASIVHRVAATVYVDSGSTDGSVQLAREHGAHVVELPTTGGFTAARARNAGWRALLRLKPSVELVQFIDGDCELVEGWLETAAAFLDTHSAHAVVCGRRRERFPERSIFNALCDAEWDRPVGETDACGGDALIRAEVLRAVDGYRDDLIAGEEPELCLRILRAGWGIHRLGAEMTIHDASMYRIGQWWARVKRGGYAYAAGAWLHGAEAERFGVRDTFSALVWGLLLPAAILTLAIAWHPLWLAALMLFPAQITRLAFRFGRGSRFSWIRACALVLGKFAEVAGILNFARQAMRPGPARLIEYK
ncbi:MAG: glycosyltransferase family 2 protein [Gammaproteobacteria bacterium]|nr:glycosyltransferase family 2 protein [Gammaproteobacteria bacterium]